MRERRLFLFLSSGGCKSAGTGMQKHKNLPRNYTEGKISRSICHGRTRKNTESKITHIFQSRMREIRQSGSEGGGNEQTVSPYPYLAPRLRYRLKAFSPRRRKDRKGRQEIRTCLVLLSVLSVLAVKFLAWEFLKKSNHREEMNTTVADASGSERCAFLPWQILLLTSVSLLLSFP